MLKTIKDVCEQTGLKRNQVLLLVHEKGSKWFQIQKLWLIEEEDFDEQLERHKRK